MDAGDEAGALTLLAALTPLPDEHDEAAALALWLGRPALAAAWAREPLTRAAALLRLGRTAEVLTLLEGQPDSARVQVLRARAEGDEVAALSARQQARAEGDGPALVAAVTLLGERLWRSDPRRALRTLAEGLKVAELLGTAADPHLLAVLALVQREVGSPEKAQRTAQKAFERSRPRSPARVWAWLALQQEADARAEAQSGELDWAQLLASSTSATHA